MTLSCFYSPCWLFYNYLSAPSYAVFIVFCLHFFDNNMHLLQNDILSSLTFIIYYALCRGKHCNPPTLGSSQREAGLACPQKPGLGTRTRGDQNPVQLPPTQPVPG